MRDEPRFYTDDDRRAWGHDAFIAQVIANTAAAIAAYGTRRDVPCKRAPAMQRKACACCGKKYGERNTRSLRLTARLGEPLPVYQGNHHVIQHRIWTGDTRFDDRTSGPGVNVDLTLWDGSVFARYDPFCTLTCALEFARACHREGMRMKGEA